MKQRAEINEDGGETLPSVSPNVVEVLHYTDENGCDIFNDWWLSLADSQAKRAIVRRIRHVEKGNFGDCRPLRGGVWELRIDVGPGYRVYYAKDGLTVVVLLCGGDKRRQSGDIARGCKFWLDWQRRKKRRSGDAGQIA